MMFNVVIGFVISVTDNTPISPDLAREDAPFILVLSP